MARNENISRYTAEQLVDARREGTRSDWDRARAKTAEAIEADAASDDAADGMVVDWAEAEIGLPQPKAVLHMRIDRDVLDFFRRGGRGYHTSRWSC